MSQTIPNFTVVVATYARGALVEPTLQSIAAQRLEDFEVLVVSDGPPAPGLAASVRKFGSRFHLAETPLRHRSQSGPNNHGWDRARGDYIAYLGHDDVWHPDHLARISEAFAAHPAASFAVSGCIYFGPVGTGDELTWVTGMFDSGDSTAPHENFFPPSSVSHKRELPLEVQRWADAATSRQPVDTVFLRGAASAGCAFVSTGEITAFKFASALRYLSYLSPDDEEQRRMVELMRQPDELERFVAERLQAAIDRGNFMVSRYETQPETLPGAGLERNERIRGIFAIPLETLGDSTWMALGDDWWGFDWYPIESGGGRQWRWSGPNHRPRLALNYTHDCPVRARLHVAHFAAEEMRSSLRVLVNRKRVDHLVVDGDDGGWVVELDVTLLPDRPTVLELEMSSAVASPGPIPDERLRGLCLVGVELETREGRRLRGDAGASRAYLQHRLDMVTRMRDRALADSMAVRNSRLWRSTEWSRRWRGR